MSRDSNLHEDVGSSATKTETFKVQVCPECGSTRLMRDYECAEIVCMDCGFVVAAKIAAKVSDSDIDAALAAQVTAAEMPSARFTVAVYSYKGE